MSALITMPNIEEIVGFRDQALIAIDEAFDAMSFASEKLEHARKIWNLAAPHSTDRYYDTQSERAAFFSAIRLPSKQNYLYTARKLIDTEVWKHVIDFTGIESLMDTQAQRELGDQMAYQPPRVDHQGELIDEEEAGRGLPPITVENIYSTLEKFQGEAEHIFRRSLAKVFSELDRSFRSHDGFKFGNRIIFERAFSSYWNSWNSERRCNQIEDVERALLILDGKDPRARYGSIVYRIKRERSYDSGQTEHESDYFKIRIFKNGNAHLWFTRKDLLLKVNQILAEWYGETIGDGQKQEKDPFADKKTALARNFGFYPTPQNVVDEVLAKVKLYRGHDAPDLAILEPSAGTGNLARPLASTTEFREAVANVGWQSYTAKPKVDCIEVQPDLAEKLKAEGIYNRVIASDFLALKPDQTNLYDRVVMNPPFDRERDIDHVMHALSFLKPGGQLVAVMSAGTEFRQTRKASAFRGLMQKWKAEWTDLPVGSFSETGTNVNTLILSVFKPA
ncbi:DUF4942 domain-containing protein [uncultured Bartonella sp.]|uniref:DUF4942 domain-containing protein n=1 Tax=uncultured Bartonella sp. TaxID=104108 RepID=UPI002630220F|nr:DUF4942 domain-containing protein [uncultured Bartonella sp.]